MQYADNLDWLYIEAIDNQNRMNRPDAQSFIVKIFAQVSYARVPAEPVHRVFNAIQKLFGGLRTLLLYVVDYGVQVLASLRRDAVAAHPAFRERRDFNEALSSRKTFSPSSNSPRLA